MIKHNEIIAEKSAIDNDSVYTSFTIAYNIALNVLTLGRKPKLEKGGSDVGTNIIKNVTHKSFSRVLQFEEFLKEGHTIYSGCFKEGAKTTAIANIENSWILFLDYDDCTFEELSQNPFVQKYGAILHPSYSANPDNLRKFHLLFIFDRAVNSQEYKKIWDVVSKEIGLKIDSSKRGANNLCFGSWHEPFNLGENFLDTTDLLQRYDELFSKSSSSKNDKKRATKKKHGISTQKSDEKYKNEKCDNNVLEHIWQKISELKEGDIEEATKALFFKHDHQFQKRELNAEERAKGMILKYECSNPFSPTDKSKTSFVITLFDNGLPPVWWDSSGNYEEALVNGRERNGGSIISYWRKMNPKLYPQDGIIEGRKFITMVHELCDELKIDRFDFRSQGNNSKRQELYQKLNTVFGSRLRFNEMTLKPELDGEIIKADTLAFKLSIEYGIEASREMAKEAVLYLAEKNSYHPVREYLEAVAEKHHIESLPSGIIDKLSTKYFGTTEDIYDIYVKKTLIAAVARIFEPGCQMKTVLTLQGVQDAGKSSWFRTLCGKEWFNDNVKINDDIDKDDKMLLRRFWIHEIDEIDKAIRKSDRANLKSNISRPDDNFRKPYGADVESYPRMSIFVATTNETKILYDPTGSVRFWVIPVQKKQLDFDGVAKERDMLWAAAVHASRAGIKWYLEGEENKQRDLANEEFNDCDAWEDLIMSFIDKYQEVAVTWILSTVLNVSRDKQDRKAQNRVEDILRKNNWENSKTQKRVSGYKFRLWKNPSIDEKLLSPEEFFNNYAYRII
ncbi:MAG: virulence-associated E family protein [Iphinoe sp. HA4291-MV1]|jgi:predicted P-loop ATPase|nr:virulence-associated E family protein [Iphinoe sp. HA4291-MV1]